jgi:hypothetical protein
MRKTAWLILSALLLGACAPRTTATTATTATTPAPRPYIPTVKEATEAFLRPYLEKDITYLLAPENLECHRTLEGIYGGSRLKVQKILADPARKEAFLKDLQEVLQKDSREVVGYELKEPPEVQNSPIKWGKTYVVRLYWKHTDVTGRRINDTTMGILTPDRSMKRLCIEDTSSSASYASFIYYFANEIEEVANKY